MSGCEEKGDGSDFIQGYWSSMESGDELSLLRPSSVVSKTEREAKGVKLIKILKSEKNVPHKLSSSTILLETNNILFFFTV